MVTVEVARYYIEREHKDVPLPAAGTIRCWISRGLVNRTQDGSVDLVSLLEHMGVLPTRAA